MLVDKQNELTSDLLFTVHQHGGDDVTWKPPIGGGNYSLIVCKVVRGPFVGTNLVSEIFKLTKKLGLYAFSFFFGMFLQSPAFSS